MDKQVVRVPSQDDVSRAKEFWLNNTYKNQSPLIEKLYSEGVVKEPRPGDVMEWHNVNSWLAKRLKEKGEYVLELEGENFWGRTTTGQSAWGDYVIKQIYDEWKEGAFRG